MKKVYYKRFIPKSSLIQPNEYRIIGLNYDAVFSVRTDNEKYRFDKNNVNAIFYIELFTQWEEREYWDGIRVLIQCSDCRRILYNAKSLKDAINYLTNLINKVKA